MWHLFAIIVAALGSYFGTRYYFPANICNMSLQDFVLNDVPIFWKVIEGPCFHDDPDYSNVEFNVEEMLVEDEEEWPEAICRYGEILEARFIFVYGTDKEKVETIDCYEPMAEIEDEMLENPGSMFGSAAGSVISKLLSDPSMLLRGLL